MLIKTQNKMKQILSMTFKSQKLVVDFWILKKKINFLFCNKETKAIILHKTKSIAIAAQKATNSSCD